VLRSTTALATRLFCVAMEGSQTDDVTYLSLSIMSYNMHGYNRNCTPLEI